MILRDKHVLITGGSAGIGLALARALLAEGARISVCGRSQERLDAAGALLGPDVALIRADVADPASHATLRAEAEQRHGPLDILINNAGVQQLMDFTDAQEERRIASEVAVNLTAPILLTESCLPGLIGRPSAAVVQVTSGLALSPKATAPVYCATKSGLRAFTRALRWQLEGSSVRVVEVLPPLVDTDMTAGRGRGKLSADAAAQEVVAGLREGRDAIYVGKTKLLWLVMWLSPALAGWITRRM